MSAILKKARLVCGANVRLRDITEADAAFVLGLRLHPEKGKYLSTTSTKLEDQVNWLREYRTKTDQAYFIVEDKAAKPLGCIRMYDADALSYRWGSWLLISGLSPWVSIESALLVYAYGRYLGFEEAKLDVRKDNRSVWKFHETFSSAELVCETDLDRHYVVRKPSIEAALKKFSALLTVPLEVQPL